MTTTRCYSAVCLRACLCTSTFLIAQVAILNEHDEVRCVARSYIRRKADYVTPEATKDYVGTTGLVGNSARGRHQSRLAAQLSHSCIERRDSLKAQQREFSHA